MDAWLRGVSSGCLGVQKSKKRSTRTRQRTESSLSSRQALEHRPVAFSYCRHLSPYYVVLEHIHGHVVCATSRRISRTYHPVGRGRVSCRNREYDRSLPRSRYQRNVAWRRCFLSITFCVRARVQIRRATTDQGGRQGLVRCQPWSARKASIERMALLDCGGRAVRSKHRPRSTMPFCCGVCAWGACPLVVPCPTI